MSFGKTYKDMWITLRKVPLMFQYAGICSNACQEYSLDNPQVSPNIVTELEIIKNADASICFYDP